MSNFPTSLDDSSSLPNPSATDKTNSPSHADLHGDENDAIRAIEAKVGIGATTPTANSLLFGTGTGTSRWGGVSSAEMLAAVSDETGTGSLVFANTPTLNTPKIDTISENTSGNGVTVDGLSIKDGKLNTNDSVTTSNITDGAIDTDTIADNAVTALKLGSDVGAYEILGRSILTVAGDTITVSGFTPKKYMRVEFLLIPSGSINTRFIFNNDTGSNYAQQFSTDNAASTDLVSQGFIELEGGSGARLIYGSLEFINVASQEKLGINNTMNNAASSGAGTAPDSFSNYFKWANTSAQVNRIDFLNQGTGSTGDLGIGSEIVVRGRD